MRLGSRGRAAGWLLAAMSTACNGAGNTDEGEVSFGPGVVTEVESTTSQQTSTSVPTTTTPTTTDPATSTDDGSGDSGTATTTSGTTTEVTTTGEPETTTTTSSSGPDTSSSGSTGDTTAGDLCEAPGVLLICDKDDDDPFHAIGLNCEGAPENTIKISNAKFTSQKVAYKVARGFGEATDPNDPETLLFSPREGEKLLVISTGKVTDLQLDGVLIETTPQYENDNNFNIDNPNQLPAPMSPLVGSNGGLGGTPALDCDGVNDCSDSILPNWNLGNKDPNDLLWASFDVTVPGGTHGFSFDVAYFSAEYPQFVGQKFNDMFIGWTTSEVYTGNVTFVNGQPFTVTALALEMESAGFVGDDPALAGTGFEGHGSTGWVTVSAQASPGESLTFAIAIMDMGDSSKATLALLDNWRWNCVGCVPVEQNPLCGMPEHPKCCGLCVESGDDPKCGTEGHPKCCVAE